MDEQTLQKYSLHQLPVYTKQNQFLEDLQHSIRPDFSFPFPFEKNKEAKEIIRWLQQILPESALSSSQQFTHWLQTQLPFAIWQHHHPIKYRYSIFLICRDSIENKTEDLFLELLKVYPLFGQKLSLRSLCSYSFYLSGYLSHKLLLIASTIHLKPQRIQEDLENRFSLFTETLILGIQSPRAISHLLPSALSASTQTDPASGQNIIAIQKCLTQWIKRFSNFFDEGLFDDLSRFLMMASPHYWQQRSPAHISRLVLTQYTFQKKMQRTLLNAPGKRQLLFRFFPASIESHFEKKSVFGLMVALSLFDKHESFDQEHLLTFIRDCIPEIHCVPSSRYHYRNPHDDRICILYLELDKRDGAPITLQEKKELGKWLVQQLKQHVQKLMPAVFMQRNEEQVMKSIIILSQELDHPQSLPQMKLFYEKQTDDSLIFTIIIVYLTKRKNFPIENKIRPFQRQLDISLERQEIVGYLANKLYKEVSILHVQVPKYKDLLRSDFSVDLYKARQKVVKALHGALGEIRDYEGGLFLKQQELLSQLQGHFSKLCREKQQVLETFFYSITPIEKQATSNPVLLGALFSNLLATLELPLTKKKDAYSIKKQRNASHLFICIRACSFSLKKILHEKMKQSRLQKHMTVSCFTYEDTLVWGCILDSTHSRQRNQWLQAIEEAISQWQNEEKEYQILRLNYGSYPISLDPRLAGDRISKAIVQMLFEGLMRMTPEMKAEPGIAEFVEISPDLKTYTFCLRTCYWSNGTLLKAQDFEYAWKKMLSPSFETPFALFLYPIKNARKAKQSELSLEEVGIFVENEQTLRVELAYPVPYFLELITLPFFFPIHSSYDKIHPQWAIEENEHFFCNGPFFLKKHHQGEHYLLEKNKNYWDIKNIHLHQIVLTKTNTPTALEMFKKKEVDWLGRPFRPWDATFQAAESEDTEILFLSKSVYWCSLATEKFPFQCSKLRKSLSLALNRKEIVQLLRDESLPAYSPIPLQHAHFPFSDLQEGDSALAKTLFREALDELHLCPQTFPSIQLIYPEGERREIISQCISRQWQKNLGVTIELNSCRWPVLFQKLIAGDYEAACIAWCPYLDNPLYTFGVFTRKEEGLNFPKWENQHFYSLVTHANYETIRTAQKNYLFQAEKILIKEAPVIPIIYEQYKALKRKSVKINSQENDCIDFKSSYFS